MKLTHDNTHDTWQFMQGESIIPLDGVDMFTSREQAITTARQQGLAVDKTGNVAIAARSKSKASRNKPNVSKSEKNNDGRRRISIWLDPASIDRIDQLAQEHGSRSDVIRWLLAQTAQEPG